MRHPRTPHPRLRAPTWLALCALALITLACGGGGGGGGTGTLSLAMTDAPFPATEGCLESALIVIDGVQAKVGDGFTDVPLASPDPDGTLTLDLLDLRAGITAALALGEVPTGGISEIRLHIVESVLVFTEDVPDAPFKVPSGMSSGLKLKIDPPVLVAAGQTTELMLDFDLANSFHTTGLGGDPTCAELQEGDTKVIFHPVIRALNESTDGLIFGRVTDGMDAGLPNVEICAFVVGTVVMDDTVPVGTTFSAPADLIGAEEGDYALLLPAGTYDLYARAQGEDPKALVLAGVVLVPGEMLVDQDFVLAMP